MLTYNRQFYKLTTKQKQYKYYLLGIRVCVGVTDTNIMWMCVFFEHICVYVCWKTKKYIAVKYLSSCELKVCICMYEVIFTFIQSVE